MGPFGEYRLECKEYLGHARIGTDQLRRGARAFYFQPSVVPIPPPSSGRPSQLLHHQLLTRDTLA